LQERNAARFNLRARLNNPRWPVILYQVQTSKKASWFCRFAKAVAQVSGHPTLFAVAVVMILVWGVTGPLFHFSDTWQLVVNTGTTVVTFLMVFLIQNTQNRDSEAMHLKLDELIRATKGAQSALLDLEELDQKELDRIREKYKKLANEGRGSLREEVTSEEV
jgi:low affinity Fe/Cu permease